jgi:SSS family solute:Na+ symporter
MAASGNIVSDIFGRFSKKANHDKSQLRLSQWVTLLVGAFTILLASQMQNVLELMLYSYAFMVSGLLVPLIGGLLWKKSHPVAAFWAMIAGGSITTYLIVSDKYLPFGISLPENIDANFFGISASFMVFVALSLFLYKKSVRYEQ